MRTARQQEVTAKGLAAAHAAQEQRTAVRLKAGEKRCPLCGQMRNLSDFHRATRTGDKSQGYCRECRSLHERRIRAEHRAARRGDIQAAVRLPPELVLIRCGWCGKERPLSAYRAYGSSGRLTRSCSACRAGFRIRTSSDRPGILAEKTALIVQLDAEADAIRAARASEPEQDPGPAPDDAGRHGAPTAGAPGKPPATDSPRWIVIPAAQADAFLDRAIEAERAALEFSCPGCPATARGGETIAHQAGCEAAAKAEVRAADAEAMRAHAESRFARIVELARLIPARPPSAGDERASHYKARRTRA